MVAITAELDTKWMKRALSLAKRAQAVGEVPVGAVIVRESEVLGEGFNAPIHGCDPTAHAEIQAIRAAARAIQNYRLSGTTLYVTIEPCAMCAGAIIHARIERVVFGARESRAGAVCSALDVLCHPGVNHQAQWEAGILANECGGLIKEFFAAKRSANKQ